MNDCIAQFQGYSVPIKALEFCSKAFAAVLAIDMVVNGGGMVIPIVVVAPPSNARASRQSACCFQRNRTQ
eukprot:2197075-Amphidinium_carterae.1